MPAIQLTDNNPAAPRGHRNVEPAYGTPAVMNDGTNAVPVSFSLPNTGGVDPRTTASETIDIASLGMAVTFDDASPAVPIAVTLDSTIADIFWCVVGVIGTQTATLTPSSGSINSGSDLSLTAGQSAILYFDGTNWLAFLGAATGGGGGGTGTVTHTGGSLAAHRVVVGNGTDDVEVIAALGTAGQYLRSAGAGADPVFSTPTAAEVTNSLDMSTTRTANQVLAGPTTGSAAAPTFRALVAADVPIPAIAGITIDGGAAVPTTGSKGFIQIPFAATILSWRLVADASGSAQITVKKCTDAGFPTTSSIVASAQPKLTSVQKATSSTLTGWTTAIAANDWLEFNLDSVTTCQRLTLELVLQRT